MVSSRWRPIIYVLVALVGVWALALAGYLIAKNARVTPDKIRAYVASADFAHLNHAQRQKAIKKLADMLNSLSLEERRHARLNRIASNWFNEMTEEEKGEFLEATMPTGFKQMLTAFEEMPDDKRKKVIDDTLRRVKESEARSGAGGTNQAGTNTPALSPELEAKVRSIGLQTFYSQSSAQTKAELAPVLEELQRGMENGHAFRR